MSLVDEIIAAAMSAVGTPYVWGGESANGYDCSGLVQMAFRAAGIDLPRVSYQQSVAGSAVPTNAMQPGDILWWDYSSRNDTSGGTGADHVAIYIGNGQMIEALHPGEPVHVVSVRAPDGVTRVPGLGGFTGNPGTLNAAAMGPTDSLGNRLAAISRIVTGVPDGPQPTGGFVPETPLESGRPPIPESQIPTDPNLAAQKADALVGPR